MAEIPESLLRRSAEAKAKALGLPVEQVLAEMKGEAFPRPLLWRNRRPVPARRQTPTPTPAEVENRAEVGDASGGDPCGGDRLRSRRQTPDARGDGDTGTGEARGYGKHRKKLRSLKSHPVRAREEPEPAKELVSVAAGVSDAPPTTQNAPPAPQAPPTHHPPPRTHHRRRRRLPRRHPATDPAMGNGPHWFSPDPWLLRPEFPRGCVPSVFSPWSRRGRSNKSKPSPPTRSTPGLI